MRIRIPRRIERRLAWYRMAREEGFVIPIVALLIIPLMAATAFAVDLGAWYARSAEIQRAADAAALAGVIWLPDMGKATSVARQTAQHNGFQHGVNATVAVAQVSATQLEVTITQDGPLYFGQIFIDDIDLSRDATSEYVLPAPLGSPRNFLGTGTLANGTAGTVYEREGLWLGITGRCTDKVQGDRIASRYENYSDNNTCSGTLNAEHSTTNYEYYVDLPATRSYGTDLLIYDGNFCTTDGGGQCDGHRTREFAPGGLDGLPRMSSTFRLYKADDTPLDDTDNPLMTSGECNSGLASSTGSKTFNGVSSTGSRDDNYNLPSSLVDGDPLYSDTNNALWRLCRISSSAPGGRYIVRVTNWSLSGSSNLNGSNAFSLIANRTTTAGFCNSATDSSCPKVYGKDYLSVYAGAGASPQFYLSELGAEHAGKTVEVTLWDAAEGAQRLKILEPTGSSTWDYINFDWFSSDGGSEQGTDTPIINVTSYNFNGDLITIRFDLPADYNPPSSNAWWKIEYAYSSSATDRSTWSVRVLGDPVHLID